MLFDTKRERELQIGRSYKEEPLKYGECLVNEKWSQSLGFEEGEIVYFSVQISN